MSKSNVDEIMNLDEHIKKFNAKKQEEDSFIKALIDNGMLKINKEAFKSHKEEKINLSEEINNNPELNKKIAEEYFESLMTGTFPALFKKIEFASFDNSIIAKIFPQMTASHIRLYHDIKKNDYMRGEIQFNKSILENKNKQEIMSVIRIVINLVKKANKSLVVQNHILDSSKEKGFLEYGLLLENNDFFQIIITESKLSNNKDNEVFLRIQDFSQEGQELSAKEFLTTKSLLEQLKKELCS